MMSDHGMNSTDEQLPMANDNWRTRPFARMVVSSCCSFMLFTTSAPLMAAPLPTELPQAALNWVQAGAATNATVGNTMTINQGSSKTILNWNKFNIGQDAKVLFVQPGVDSIALNKIGGNSASEIFGQLGANGTIYLINNNGILFGAGSQVNVHGLVASTLNIDNNQFLNSSISQVVNQGNAAFSGGTKADANVVVEKSAKIQTDSGGQVLMFAPTVINNGDIATPDGQTILAASKDKVYLAASDNDVNLRGLLVEVDTGGDVTNVGNIVAERGNITLLGLAVNQEGRLRATTSVDVNGSIRLLARDRAVVVEKQSVISEATLLIDSSLDKSSGKPSASQLAVPTHTGTVTTSAGSVTEVVADENGKTAADAQTQNVSRIDIVGNTINIQDGSQLTAKAGRINITATQTPNSVPETFSRSDSRIFVGKNATLDVSGENVLLPMSRRVVAVELRGDELKDAPLQRNGVLRGKTVYVDIDKGSPLIADLKPTLAKIQRDVKERSTTGGIINLKSQGDVVLSDNATLNISGGSVQYAADLVNTTKLISNGMIVDIGSADPNRHYDGILGEHTEIHPKWGKSVYGQNSIFNKGTYRNSFVEGANGGALTTSAPALYGFDLANIRASSTTGAYQRNAPSKGGAVSIVLGKNAVVQESATLQNVLIDQLVASTGLAITDAMPKIAGQLQALNISADKLNRSGLSSFSVDGIGSVHLKTGANIALSSGADITLKGSAVNIDGKISAPAGTIKLQTQAPAWASNGGNFAIDIGNKATLSTSGRWVNDLADGPASTQPLLLNGGKITVDALGDLSIANGAELHADAGAQLSDAGKFKGGNGGSIALTSRGVSSLDTGSKLLLGGTISAYGFGNGGSLSLTANAFQIGGALPVGVDPLNAVLLNPDLFSNGGFSSYAISSNRGGIDLVANTNVNLQQQNLAVSSLANAARQSTGTDVRNFSLITTLPAWLRKPVNLLLSVSDRVSTALEKSPVHDLKIETGAAIFGEPGANISLVSDSRIYVDGDIEAPGGNISLTLNEPGGGSSAKLDRGFDPAQAIWLGEHAQLRATAARVTQDNIGNFKLGTIYDAGTIALKANRGAIVAAPGSVLDISGKNFVQDIAVAGSGYRSQSINAAAGAIDLTAAEGILVYSDLKGSATGDGRGGKISFGVDANNRKEALSGNDIFIGLYADARNINVSEDLPAWNSSLQYGVALPSTTRGIGLVGASQVRNGGFSSLTLSAANKFDNNNKFTASGTINFVSDLDLLLRDALVLDSTNIAINNHTVTLSAGSLGVGQDDANKVLQQSVAVQNGTGNLTLAGKFIELLGNIGISGAQDIQLNSAGDIRVRSQYLNSDRTFTANTFSAAGNLSLSATQVYPATLTDYLFNLTGTNSVFTTFNNGAARAPVLSAGGTLRVHAPTIEHGGTLLAPLGTIELAATKSIHLAPGSVVDVSGNNQLIPYGRLLGGDLAWTYPLLSSQPIVVSQTPGKQISMTAPSVVADSGSQVNLSGGGDIYGIEQVPGPGGSKDFLDAANANGAFAVIPALKSPISPYDAIEMRGTGIAIGQTIYLDGANGLPAGEYAVLPAHYALLPGAYLVTPSHTTVAQGTTGQRIDGTPLVSGRFGRAFAAQYDAQWQSFYIEPGSVARTRTEYNESTGDKFFADKNVDLAKDAGRISLSVRDQLQLNGTLNAISQNGHGAQMDIVADLLEVVAAGSSTTSTNGAVLLDAGALSAMGVDSLLLGGVRSRAGDTAMIDVKSSRVSLRNGAVLSAPDLILAASDRVGIENGAQVSGVGNSRQNYTALQINANTNTGSGDGALLRLSSTAQVDVKRVGTTTDTAGTLDIATGAQIRADKSALLDATGDMRVDGNLALQNNGSLNLSANRISIGDLTGSNASSITGVKFSGAQLAALNASTLRLSSRSSIDFYGDVNFANQHAELNTGALRAMTPGTTQIAAANTLQLSNSTHVAASTSTTAGGDLHLSARTIELGSANDNDTIMQLSGFSTVQLGASGVTNTLIGQGQFKLATDGALNVVADHITGSAKSTTKLTAVNAIDLAAANVPPADALNAAVGGTTANALGSIFDISGARVALGTQINMPSGRVTLAATGAQANDSVVLRDGAGIDVGGRTVPFTYNNVRSDGGEVHLFSAAGNVESGAGATVQLGGIVKDGSVEGGNAGLLDIVAASGQAVWNAVVDAKAGTNDSTKNYQGGSLKLDVASIADVGSWLTQAASSGIDKLISLRARAGDISVDQNIRAQSIAIAADAGNLSVNSTLDASGMDGGSIALNAGNNVNLGANATLLANATGSEGRGGSVQIGTRNGSLSFAAGSRMDVGGNGGRDGTVMLRAPRNVANNDVAFNNNGVTINGAERTDLEAFKIYNSTVLDNSLMTVAQASNDAFMANEAAIKTRLGTLGAQNNFHLRPGVEIDSATDLTVTEQINFVALRSGANAEPGILTLRAANDVNIMHSLLDGFTDDTSSLSLLLPPFPVLLPGQSWDYRLVGGADNTAANITTVRNGVGDVVASTGADLITGAGDIGIYAGRDVNVLDAGSVITSLGKTKLRAYDNPLADLYGLPASELMPDTGDYNAYWLFLIGLRYPQYPEGGGNVTVAAGRDATFAKADYFFTDWISRIGGSVTIDTAGADIAPTYNLTTWGILLDDLMNQQGIAVMGGGNLAVNAGRDISNLYATLPVTARQDGNGSNHYAIVGGGNADIVAGRDILSPRIEVDKGHLNLTAGRDISAKTGDLNAIFAIADTQVNLNARGNIMVDAIANSTVLPMAAAQNNGGLLPENYFFTYTDAADVSARTLSGDVTLTNNNDKVYLSFYRRFSDPLVTVNSNGKTALTTQGLQISRLSSIYPANVDLAALQGDIHFQNQTLLFPSASGNLVLNAGQSIAGIGLNAASLLISDAGSESLPWYNSVFNINALSSLVSDAFSNLLHATTPVHRGDASHAIVDALAGDIAPQFYSGADNNAQFSLTSSKVLLAHAGRDIVNTNFSIQNTRDSDISQLMAGRDLGFPLTISDNGRIDVQPRLIRVGGPGRLNVIAGRNIDLGASSGIESIGNNENSALTTSGADITLMAGINGRSALTDPILYNAFSDQYFAATDTLKGSFIDWFSSGGFKGAAHAGLKGDAATLVSVFTGVNYADDQSAVNAYRALPTLTQQSIALQAWQVDHSGDHAYSANLVDFVSFDRFGGDLAKALNDVTHPAQLYTSNADAAAALAALPVEQQHAIALRAFNNASTLQRSELMLAVMFNEIREGSAEHLSNVVGAHTGYARSSDAIALMFPGHDWKGNLNLVSSGVRTLSDGDISFVVPGGNANIGLASKIKQLEDDEVKNAASGKSAAKGLIAQRYGAIDGMVSGDINVNQSRVFALGGGGISLYSSNGNVDAGRGAKSALTIPPPKIQIDSKGNITLVFPPAISGSGIQTANSEKSSTARGPLVSDDIADSTSDIRAFRERYFRSLLKPKGGDTYLSAPQGVVDAGDAGISVGGNLLIAAQKVLGADNISVGGISIGVPTTTSIGAGTLSLGDVASSATESATNSMNDAIKEAAAALAESSAAFVTVDIIGVSN